MSLMPAAPQHRPTALLDAAVEVIDTAGLRGLTHRAVEARAGFPPGTCVHHFSTRSTLVGALLTRITDQERADVERFCGDRLDAGMEPTVLLEAATATLAHWLGPCRARTRAGLLLRLDPLSRRNLTPGPGSFSEGVRDAALRIVGDPGTAALAVSLVEGVLASQLMGDQSEVDVDQVRSLLAAVVDVALPDHPRRAGSAPAS